MVGQYHQLNEYESEQTPGSGEGQGSLVCCSPWGHKECDIRNLKKILLYISYVSERSKDDKAFNSAPSVKNYFNNIYADDTTLMAESEEELKKPLDESEKGE